VLVLAIFAVLPSLNNLRQRKEKTFYNVLKLTTYVVDQSFPDIMYCVAVISPLHIGPLLPRVWYLLVASFCCRGECIASFTSSALMSAALSSGRFTNITWSPSRVCVAPFYSMRVDVSAPLNQQLQNLSKMSILRVSVGVIIG
jgi:hypothetical protein